MRESRAYFNFGYFVDRKFTNKSPIQRERRGFADGENVERERRRSETAEQRFVERSAFYYGYYSIYDSTKYELLLKLRLTSI